MNHQLRDLTSVLQRPVELTRNRGQNLINIRLLLRSHLGTFRLIVSITGNIASISNEFISRNLLISDTQITPRSLCK